MKYNFKTYLLAAFLLTASAAGSAAVCHATSIFESVTAKDPCKVNKYITETFQLSDLSDADYLQYAIKLTLDSVKKQPGSMSVQLTIVNCKGQSQAIKVALHFDLKTNGWFGKFLFKNDKDCPWKLKSYSIWATNDCGEEYSTDEVQMYNKNGGVTKQERREKIHKRIRKNVSASSVFIEPNLPKYNDAASNAHAYRMDLFNLDEILDNSLITYSMRASFKNEGIQPEKVNVLMIMVNQNNESQRILTELKYDAKYNCWSGGQTIPQSKDCPWKLSQFRILAENIHGDKFLSGTCDVDSWRNRDLNYLQQFYQVPSIN